MNDIKKVFSQVVLMLAESGHYDLQKVYTDWTKIEANANLYTFVWGNAIKTSNERIVKQLDELWEYIQIVAAQELKDTTPVSFISIDPEKVARQLNR